MPRFNKENTPPEKRRAPKGSRVAEGRFPHTAESQTHFEALKARWGLSDAETHRKALALAVASGK
jgi:hypothetical protein